jgi:hypothetical protein
MYVKNFWRTGEGLTSRYCLNRRQPKQKMIKDGRTWTTGVFILLPNEEDRLNLIARAVRNYRKTLKK